MKEWWNSRRYSCHCLFPEVPVPDCFVTPWQRMLLPSERAALIVFLFRRRKAEVVA